MSKEFSIGSISEKIMEEHDIISSDGLETIKFPKLEVPKGINYVLTDDPEKDPAKLILIAIKEGLSALMIWPKGTGKTTTAGFVAQELNRPLSYLQLTGATNVDSFVGKWLVNKEGTYWVDWILTRAMKFGHVLVLDELNQALPEITSVLHSVMDERQILVLDEKGAGEVIKAHKDFRIIACINPTEDYAGNKEMNQALVDRFKVVVAVDYPDARKELAIVLKNSRVKITDSNTATFRKSPSGGLVKNRSAAGVITRMVRLANQFRKDKAANKFAYEISTRNLIDWAVLCSYLPIKEAAKYSFINKMEVQESELNKFMDSLDKEFSDGETFKIGKQEVDEDTSIETTSEEEVEIQEVNIPNI